MLASQRLSDHAIHAKVLLVEPPGVEKFLDDIPLLIPTTQLRNMAWILSHGIKIEKRREAVENSKKEV